MSERLSALTGAVEMRLESLWPVGALRLVCCFHSEMSLSYSQSEARSTTISSSLMAHSQSTILDTCTNRPIPANLLEV